MTRQLTIITFILLTSITFFKGHAQDSIHHKFTDLKIEIRADGDFIANYADSIGRPISHTNNDYGLHGKYFNIVLSGEFGKGFAYSFKQRIIPTVGSASLFDNTDWLYLQYSVNRWSFRLGKDVIAIGGWEYDAAPIDVYQPSFFWQHINCYALAVSAIYNDKSGHNQLFFQVSNSPYVCHIGSGEEWKQGLMGYSIYWKGFYPHFKALYSIGLYEYKRGSFINYIALGNRFDFGKCSWYIDYMNRATSFDKFFGDFSVMTRFLVNLNKVNLFVKGGYDQNLAEKCLPIDARDNTMLPNHRYVVYGLGVEYMPIRDVRLHLAVSNNVLVDTRSKEHEGNLNVKLGVTWTIDFLRYFEKKLNH